MRQERPLAPSLTTEQPFSGSALLTPVGEGTRKGVPKIVCLANFLTGFVRPVGSPFMRSETYELWSLECAHSSGQ